MINLFENGEFDLVSKTYKNIDYNIKRERPKEKGIVIKVKKNDEEEEKKEEDKKENEKKNDIEIEEKKRNEVIQEKKNDGNIVDNNKVTNNIFDEIPPDIFDDNENNIEPLI